MPYLQMPSQHANVVLGTPAVLLRLAASDPEQEEDASRPR